MVLDVLVKIARELNSKNIKWVVGSSIVMNHFNLVDKMNDIDIIISREDIHKADEILKQMGVMRPLEIDPGIYTTEVFHEYVVDGIDVDMMCGFGISHEEGIYEYELNNDTYVDSFNLDGEKIYYSSLEDWYVLYQLIGGREVKVNKIEDYLMNEDCNVSKLSNILKKSLPISIANRVEKLLIKKR
jgi:hypothetical protein